MASADYYPTRRPSATNQASLLAPPSSMGSYPQTSSAPNGSPLQYPQAPPPPPYQQPLDFNKPSVRFAPSPLPPQQRASFSHGPRPNPQMWNQPYSQPVLPPSSNPVHSSYNMPYAVPPGQYLAPPAPQSHFHMNEDESDLSAASGYSSDPESHRRRRRHSHSGHERHGSDSKNTRSTNTDGFIGAAGGGLIGDLICPGMLS